jgi:hypothetical protein
MQFYPLNARIVEASGNIYCQFKQLYLESFVGHLAQIYFS